MLLVVNRFGQIQNEKFQDGILKALLQDLLVSSTVPEEFKAMLVLSPFKEPSFFPLEAHRIFSLTPL